MLKLLITNRLLISNGKGGGGELKLQQRQKQKQQQGNLVHFSSYLLMY